MLTDGTTLLLIAAAAIVALNIAIMIVLGVQRRQLGREREQLLRRLEHDSRVQGRDSDRLNRALNDTVSRVAELGGALDARMDALTQQSDRQMGEMRELVDGRLGESFRAVNAQLTDVHKGLGEMRRMGEGLGEMRRVLGNVKSRGVWGELQLESVLGEMFAPEMYVANAAIPADSRQRVEFALKLFDKERGETLLPIDSKFPQEDYLRLVRAQEAGDRAQVDASTKQLEQALLTQAKTISEKYIRPPQTVDFAVMFLPAESLYAEAARMDGFISKVQSRYRVLVAGPATLTALLTALQMGFRSQQLEKRSAEALEKIDALRHECEKLTNNAQELRKHLSAAESDLDRMESGLRAVRKAVGE